jgi:hypothetical protein
MMKSQWQYCFLASLAGYALLSASQTAAYDFAKK